MTPTPPSPPSYSPGLEGVIAGETAICHVDPSGILLYRGYDIHGLAAKATFEQVVGLLVHGQLSEPAETERLRIELADAAALPPAVIDALRLIPPTAHPMDALRTGVSMLSAFDAEVDDNAHVTNVRKAIRLIGRTPTVMATAWRLARGQPIVPVDSAARFAERLLHGISGAAPQPWQAEAMDVVLALYAEHDFNAGTFSARVTASTLSDIYAAVTSAIGTLKGPLHGGANEQAMNVLREVGTGANAAAWIAGKLARKEKVMGFGHRVYRTGDSRVPVMRELLRKIGQQVGQEQWADICEALETAMSGQKGICANVDLYAAPVLHLLGIPAALNTPIFACARMAGWCAHVIEQHDHNRLIRPKSIYVGPARRKA
jgi:2-methylcitrate synthase/citrate synthase II